MTVYDRLGYNFPTSQFDSASTLSDGAKNTLGVIANNTPTIPTWQKTDLAAGSITRTDYFYNLVSGFNSNYVSNENYFKISYEELYYGKGLQEIINYLNLDCVKNESFPYGKKYRIDLVRNKLIWYLLN